MDDTATANGAARLTADPRTHQRGGPPRTKLYLQPAMRDLGLAPGQWPVPPDRVSASAPTVGKQRVSKAATDA